MLQENYFENLKELVKLRKAYANIANYLDKKLIKLNKESFEVMKHQEFLIKKMNSNKSSNDIAWYQDQLIKNNNQTLIFKGSIQILSELSEVLKQNGIIEGNDKEKQIIT